MAVRSALILTRFTLQEAISRRLILAALVLSLLFLGLFALGFNFVYDRRALPLVAALLTLMGLYVLNFLAGFLALFLSVGAVSGEIESGALHAVLARPIRRADFIVGRWMAYLILIGAYIALMSCMMLLIARVVADFEVPDPPRAIGLMALSAVTLLTLSLFGSTLMSTLANGVVVFTLFGLAWLAGVIELIGRGLQNQEMLNLGVGVSLLIPSDALWRGASYYLQPSAMLAMAGRGTSDSPLPLLFASTVPLPEPFLLWTLAYPLLILAATTWTFSRRDL